VERADVFVQNFRPGVAKRMGIGEETLRGVCPRLVYVSVSAFGPEGPWAGKPAFDHVAQAASGIAAVQSDRESGEPRFVQNAIVDKVTALTASQAITAALLHRATTGVGQHLELSMLSAALHFIWPDGMARDTLLGEGVELRPPLADAYRMIPLKDGFIAMAAITQEQVHALLANLDVFRAEVAEAAAALTVAECVANFEREDVPCAPVVGTHELAEHPQVRAGGLVEEIEHPIMGRMRRPRPPVRFSHSPCVASRHAPALGEHSDEVLAELGLGKSERAELRAKGIVA
jgi:crotonobetainyl-CoA:carnitine CoA-transferase CaiB-like acyl-CoA transferase